MDKWIELPAKKINDLVVYEVKCPHCGYRETFHSVDKAPRTCYICGTEYDQPYEIHDNLKEET